MENNIAKKIKEEFKNREIKPTNTWEVLNARLKVNTTKKERKKLTFLRYTAVFIGLLFGLILFLNDRKINVDKPIIVDQKVKTETLTNNLEIIDEPQILTKKNINPKNIITTQVSIKSENLKKQKLHFTIVKNSKKKNSTKKPDFTQNLKTELATNNTRNLIINQIYKNPQNVNIKLNLRAPNIHNPKKRLSTSDKDIDLMLARVLDNKANYKIKKVNIQSTYLQYSVENEINKPFIKKLLKAFRTEIETVEERITSNN